MARNWQAGCYFKYTNGKEECWYSCISNGKRVIRVGERVGYITDKEAMDYSANYLKKNKGKYKNDY